jgi:predicted nucleic acid-binding protein
LKLRCYLDTSVIGAVFDKEDPPRIEVTKDLFKMLKAGSIEGYVSDITIAEIIRAPQELKGELQRILGELRLNVLGETMESGELAEAYVVAGVVPEKFRDDARHIAVAVVHDLDLIVSWNFRHMVNVERKRAIHSVNIRLGYKLLDLVSPWEVVSHE